MSDFYLCFKNLRHRQLGRARLALLTVGILLLASCGGGGGGAPPPPPLTLSSPAASLGAGTTLALTAAGGQIPYVFSVASGAGTVDSTGLFTAPATSGTTVVEVTDKNGATAKTSLQIIVVAFVNATASVDSSTTTAQTATGGAPPYAYSIAAGGGSIDASGQFTSPKGPAVVTLEVADSKGAIAQASITVNAPLIANQSTATIGGGTSLLVGAAGGQGPFTYKVTSGGGSVDASGQFTAPPTAGTSVVSIADSLGSSTLVTITINPPLSISPPSATLTASSGQTTPFAGMNGVPPYQYSVVSGSGTVNAQGIYTVGTISGVSAVQVTDGQGTTAAAQVRALRIRVNAAVFTTVTDGTNLYVGGRFSAVNPYSAPRLAIVDQASGNLATTCDLGTGFLSGSVNAIVTVGNSIYVAGNFNQYRGAVVGKLAKIDATTCAIDPVFIGGGGFGPQLGETVDGLAVSGSSLYAVGNISTYRGATIPGMAKLDLTTGAADPAFKSPQPDAPLNAVVVSGTSVYVGGSFTHIGGVAAPYLAKLDAATGAVDAAFAAAPGADSGVATLAIAANQLYVGGAFTHFAGVQTALARVNATTGALDSTFTQSVANVSQVQSLLVSGNSLYVGRAFPGATPVLAKVDTGTGTTDATFGTGAGFDFGVNSLLLANSSLYVGGNFTTYRGTSAHNLAKIDPASGALDATFTQPTGGNDAIYALAATGSQVIAGGGFSTYRGSAANNIAKFSLATDEPDLAFSAAAGTNSNVIKMALNGSALYLGGVFTSCGGINSFEIAKVNATTGACDATFAAGGGAPFFVNTMLIHAGSLYIGGGNLSVTHLAKMNLLTGQTDPAFSVNGGPDGMVIALADSQTAIYVGGQFQNYGALPARNLAKVDPATGALDQTFTQTTGAGGSSEYVQSLLVAGNSLYAGGVVNSYRGSTVQGLLKLDPVTGALDSTFSQSTGFGNAEALLNSGTSIFVAGSFQSYRGTPSFNLAKVDASSGTPDPTFTSSLTCDSCGTNFDTLTLVGTKLYVGGDAPTLYRGTPIYGVFPVDLSTGNPTDP
jgi:trimeric autotransporter adhesin